MHLTLEGNYLNREPEPHGTLPEFFPASFHAPVVKGIGYEKLHGGRRTEYFARRDDFEHYEFHAGDEILLDVVKPDFESQVAQKRHSNERENLVDKVILPG